MSYSLKSMESADIKKILADCAADRGLPHFERTVIAYQEGQYLSSLNLALDQDKGSYFFILPKVTRSESFDTNYCLFLQGKLHIICASDPFGNSIYIKNKEDFVEPGLSELKAEILKAFSVYGRYGWGQNDVREHEFPLFYPEFVEGQ